MGKSAGQKEESRQIRELRKQLIKVKKENAQLRKRIHQLEGVLIDVEEIALEVEEKKISERRNIPEIKELLHCSRCSSTNTIEFPLRGLKYYNCLDCGSKGKIS